MYQAQPLVLHMYKPISSSQQPSEAATFIIHILLFRKQHRDVKQLAQDHTAKTQVISP